MSVELYALFSYAFTAAIALVMIGAVVMMKEVWNNNGRKYRCTIIPWHRVFYGSRYNHCYCQNCTYCIWFYFSLLGL